MKAVLKKVICIAIEKERKTEGGLVLPECHTKDQVDMKVISVGSESKSGLKKDDIVIVSGFQGHELIRDGVKYRVFEDEQILAVYE